MPDKTANNKKIKASVNWSSLTLEIFKKFIRLDINILWEFITGFDKIDKNGVMNDIVKNSEIDAETIKKIVLTSQILFSLDNKLNIFFIVW